MALRVITPPAFEPVTLAEAKLHARVDGSEEDTLFSILIASARAHGEALTRRAFVTQTFELTLAGFPASGTPFEIPRPPLQSITSIKYLDPAGMEQTMSAQDYYVVTGGATPARVYPVSGAWPGTARRANAVVVEYEAGWPQDEDEISTAPAALKAWMLVRITSLYAQREKYVVNTGRDSLVTLDRDFCDSLLDAFTVIDVG